MTRPIAVIDAETDPFRRGRTEINPFVFGYYNGSEYHQFGNPPYGKECIPDLIEFISQREEIIYAHNGGRFDFHFLLDYLDPYDDIKIINGRIASMRIGLAELRDSWLIINEPLSKYKKDNIDYSIMEIGERNKKNNQKIIEAYLKSDCVYLWEMCSEFNRRFGSTLTQAGAAMKHWIKIKGETPEYTSAEFYNAFTSRPSEENPTALGDYYFGGRVECFESGIIDTDFQVYDINSAYMRAMLEKHPYSANYERISGYAPNSDFYAVSCIAKGCFPFRGLGSIGVNSFSGLAFPSDDVERIYYVTGWELQAARDTKTIRRERILESIRFVKHTDFTPYIEKFWNERKIAKAKGDILGNLFAKLMGNSLYGKWAANPDNYHNYMVAPRTDENIKALGNAEAGNWQWSGELGNWILAQKELDDYQQRFYNVATGASITGYVRAFLWRAICSCEGVMYVDTDSVACRKKGNFIKLGNDLGEWKNEGDFVKAGIAGKKLYIFKGKSFGSDGKRIYKIASKGAKLSKAQLWQVSAGGIVEYESEVPTFSIKKAPYMTNRQIVNTAGK